MERHHHHHSHSKDKNSTKISLENKESEKNEKFIFNNFEKNSFQAHSKLLTSFDWNFNGSNFATSSEDNQIKIWNLNFKNILTHSGHSSKIEKILFHPSNENILFSASCDKTVRVWDNRSNNVPSRILKTKGELLNFSVKNNGDELVALSKSKDLCFINLKMNKLLYLSTNKKYYDVKWDNDDLYLTTEDGRIEILQRNEEKFSKKILICSFEKVYCLDFDKEFNYFAAGAKDCLLSIWDKKNQICLKTYNNVLNSIKHVNFSHDGKFLAYGTSKDIIDIVSVDSKDTKTLKRISISNGTTTKFLKFHPNNYILSFSGNDHVYFEKINL